MWLFNEAPANCDFEQSRKYPKCLKNSRKVDLATKKVINKMEQANALVAAVNSIANAPIGKK